MAEELDQGSETDAEKPPAAPPRLVRRLRALTRSQVLLALAAAIVLIGALAGLIAHLLQPAHDAIGPMPAAALGLPSDIRYVAGIDVQRFASSPLYSRYAQSLPFAPEALKHLQGDTGLNLGRDLTHVLFAGDDPQNSTTSLVVLVLRPEHTTLGRWLSEQNIRRYSHENATIFILATQPMPRVAALLAPNTLVIGLPDQVEHAVSERAHSATPLRANETLTTLVAGLRPDAPLWLAYQLPTAAPAGDLSPQLAQALASLKTLTMAGELEPTITLSFTATTDAPQDAKQLATVINQIVGVALYAAHEDAALRELASSVNTIQQEQHVLVTARIPYTLLDALAAPRTNGAATSTTRLGQGEP
jgi:hypothetical protein